MQASATATATTAASGLGLTLDRVATVGGALDVLRKVATAQQALQT